MSVKAIFLCGFNGPTQKRVYNRKRENDPSVSSAAFSLDWINSCTQFFSCSLLLGFFFFGGGGGIFSF